MIDSSNPVKWGIIGCGSIASNAVAPAIGWSQMATIHGIASRHKPRAEHLAKELYAKEAFGSYDDLLKCDDIEAVYIATPNNLHEEWIIKAAKAGKHVLCEKSLTIDSKSMKKIKAAVQKADVLLMDAFMYRHHPQWAVVNRIISEKKLGEIKTIKAGLTGTLPQKQNHRWTEPVGGGALLDVTCYGINVARLITGKEPQRVSAFADTNTPAKVDGTSTAILDFGNGTTAFVEGSLETRHVQYCSIEGTKGRLVIPSPFIPGFDPTVLVVEAGSHPEHYHIHGANHYLHMIEHFCLCLRDKDHDFAPAEDGEKQMLVLDACKKSWESGKTIKI